MTQKSILVLLLNIFLWVSCTYDPLDVDSSNTMVSIGFVNVDRALKSADSLELVALSKEYKKQFREAFEYQVGYCMQIGKVSNEEFASRYLEYKKDTFIQRLEKEISVAFPTTTALEASILNGFKFLKTHMPKAKTPEKIVFINSLFVANAFTTENEIAVGLERYLGAKSPSVRSLPSEPFYDWVKEGMDVRYLERDVLTTWINTHLVKDADGNLAQKMIRWGKVLYLTEAAFPQIDKSIILRYSKEDFNWATDNEAFFWKHLIDQELLFKIDERVSQNMLGEGPFTPGLPEKAPDRLGQFLGYRMVKQYMESSKSSFEKLMNVEYNEILQAYESE